MSIKDEPVGVHSSRVHLAQVVTSLLPHSVSPSPAMARFATLAAFVSALTAIAAATPIAGEETQVLEKRITHTGQVGLTKPCTGTYSSC